MTAANLEMMFNRADRHDIAEGKLAYQRYHQLMKTIAEKYGHRLPSTVAAFVALSPNNDYYSNLRSLITIMHHFKNGVELSRMKVSTYDHCKVRAYNYLVGNEEFVTKDRGLKILNFYYNVLDPTDNRFVTVDGHVCAAWRNKNLTMKEALVKGRKEYNEIAGAIKELSFKKFLIPNQYQAIIWFARKRTLNVKYDPQIGLFDSKDDLWRTVQNVDDIKPYEAK